MPPHRSVVKGDPDQYLIAPAQHRPNPAVALAVLDAHGGKTPIASLDINRTGVGGDEVEGLRLRDGGAGPRPAMQLQLSGAVIGADPDPAFAIRLRRQFEEQFAVVGGVDAERQAPGQIANRQGLARRQCAARCVDQRRPDHADHRRARQNGAAIDPVSGQKALVAAETAEVAQAAQIRDVAMQERMELSRFARRR